MKINIAAAGRFHVADLARELSENGHEVRFYSYVPTRRLMKFGLKKECSYSLFFLMLPVLACLKISKRANWATKLEWFVLDHLVAWIMKPCDAFIAMSSIYVYSFEIAKKKYGAITILERGSNHTLDIQEIFTNSPHNGKTSFALNSNYAVDREIKNYEIVDYISIASEHVKKGFVKRGISSEKIFVNPYGVNLSMFYPTEIDDTDVYDVIMVGNWCWRKGCDLIIESSKKLKIKILHVGSITDVEFPKEVNFCDIGTVDETKLIKYYSKAKVLVLPSREDGFGMVLAQATACGLPIVCSENTGGNMIKSMIGSKDYIFIIDKCNSISLQKSIADALILANTQHGLRNYAPELNSLLSWSAYGLRYNDFLQKLSSRNSH